MTDRSGPVPDLSSIRGEMWLLKVAVFLMIVFVALHYVSLFRLFGVPGIPPILLIIYRAMDLILVLAFLAFCGPRVKFEGFDFLLITFAFYPFLIGLARENFSLTFANDTAIYFFFVAKIIIFRTVLQRIHAVVDLDTVFRKSARKLVLWCTAVAIFLFSTVFVVWGQGRIFYYQAPAELTFAAALLLAQGKIFGYLLLLLLAVAGGKRMIMVGLLAMGLVAGLTHAGVRTAALRYLAAAAALVPLALIVGSTIFNVEIVFVDKLQATIRQFSRAMEMSDNLIDLVMFMDPPRFSEYVSLKPYLTGWSLLFGNGYGFRYELDAAFLATYGYEGNDDVTNAHFTPLAITAKFGLLGTMIWLTFIAKVLTSRINRHSYLQYACRLAFLSIFIQSFFAFSFFINFFTSFYIAMAAVGERRANSYRLLPVIPNQGPRHK